MNKQLCFTVLLILSVVLSVSVACASDVNVTDSCATNLVDDAKYVCVSNGDEDDSSEILTSCANVDNDTSKVLLLSSKEVLESDYSNTLSTNTDSNFAEDITYYAAYCDEVAMGAISNKEVSESTLDNFESNNNEILAASMNNDDNVILAKSNVNSILSTVYSGGNLIATLTDGQGNPISGAKIGFANNGVTYIRTDKNGKATYSTAGLKSGSYVVKVKFYGDDVYSESNQVVTQIVVANAATVNSVATTLTASNVEVNYGSNGYLIATLRDANGNPVKGAKVGFANNGVKYVVTDANGQAKYSTCDLAVGKYSIKMKFYGNDVYLASNQAIATITVNKIFTVLTSANLNINYGSNGNLVATLKDSNGKAIKGAKVGFANNGVKYVVTDANGQAKYSTSGLAAGTYTVKMKFYGDDVYPASNQVTISLVINKVATTLTSANVNVVSGSEGYLVATLKDAYGNPVKGAKVSFDNNGVKYVVTDAKGQAKYSTSGLAAGTYNVKMAFYGSESYLASNEANAKITVAKKEVPSSSTKPTSVSINDILTGADSLKTYYSKNNKLPATVTVAGYAFTLPEFLYLMDQAIYQLGNSNTAAIKCIYGVKSPASTTTGDAIDAQLYKTDYLTVSKNVANYIKNNNRAPSYASSTVGKIMYSDLIDISSRILAFYKNNDKYMPNYVTLKTNGPSSSSSSSSSSSNSSSSSSSSSSTKPTSVSINDILTGANNLKNYFSSNGVLPKTVTAAGYAFTLSEFLYLMSQATYQLGNSSTTAIKCIYGVKDASSSSTDSINAQLARDDYLTVSKNVANYIKTNNRVPSYASSSVGKINHNVLVDAFSRILAFYKNNDKYMPNYVTIVQGSSSSSSYTIGGMNVKNTITNLDPYYKATTNCQVNNEAIKSIVSSLTAGLTSDVEKATVIYNYVRDQVSYSFYYDTQKGAVGTLNSKSGNCVDQAHLLVAMYRTAGLAARYEHGTCYFTLSGSTYGHVWTQVLIDNVWVVGDPTSNRNSFGNVVNWNTNSYTHKAYYASLPF